MKRNRILYLIDDDRSDLELMETLISSTFSSVRVHTFQDGGEALVNMKMQLNSKDPSLPGMILMDLKMPKNDGFEILSKIRNTPSLNLLPVVIFSSSRISSDILKSYSLGAMHMFQNPSILINLQKFLKIPFTSGWKYVSF